MIDLDSQESTPLLYRCGIGTNKAAINSVAGSE